MVQFNLENITVADCLAVAKLLTAYDIEMTKTADTTTLRSRFAYHQIPPPYDLTVERWESHLQTVLNELEASVEGFDQMEATSAIFMYIYDWLDTASSLLQPPNEGHIYTSHDEALTDLLKKYMI